MRWRGWWRVLGGLLIGLWCLRERVAAAADRRHLEMTWSYRPERSAKMAEKTPPAKTSTGKVRGYWRIVRCPEEQVIDYWALIAETPGAFLTFDLECKYQDDEGRIMAKLRIRAIARHWLEWLDHEVGRARTRLLSRLERMRRAPCPVELSVDNAALAVIFQAGELDDQPKPRKF